MPNHYEIKETMEKNGLPGIKVLVIDDETFMRTLLLRALATIGIKDVVMAINGSDGLANVKKLERKLDLILCDLDMPRMNGFEFVHRLREIPDPALANLPVVIITGNSQVESVRSAVELGISGFLVKPITSKALEERIKKALSSPMIGPDTAKKL